MEALKLNGKIDESGQLILSESVNLSPGAVEIIILKSTQLGSLPSEVNETPPLENKAAYKSKVKAFTDWFETAVPVSPDFDADEAKWQYLKEKHNL